MVDVLLIALVIGFFLAADLFVRGCGRIVERSSDERSEDRP
jgi:hypothetical protein